MFTHWLQKQSTAAATGATTVPTTTEHHQRQFEVSSAIEKDRWNYESIDLKIQWNPLDNPCSTITKLTKKIDSKIKYIKSWSGHLKSYSNFCNFKGEEPYLWLNPYTDNYRHRYNFFTCHTVRNIANKSKNDFKWQQSKVMRKKSYQIQDWWLANKYKYIQ